MTGIMKKLFLFLLVAVITASCSNDCLDEIVLNKKINISFSGDFSLESIAPMVTRSGNEATDVWIFDYNMNGELVQEIHQTISESNLHSLELSFGKHNLYFVISNGGAPTVDRNQAIIKWETPGDTFQAAYEVDITDASDNTLIIDMNRVAAKLVIKVEGGTPVNAKTFRATTSRWYYSISYKTGKAFHHKNFSYENEITNSTEYAYYTLVDESFYTGFDISLLDGSNEQIANAQISSINMQRGKCTTYTGSFNYSNSVMSFIFDIPSWEAGEDGTW